MTHQVKAVLFDLDGVVVFTDKYHYLAWKRLADEQGWAFDEEVNHLLRGIPRLASLQAILDHNRVSLPADALHALAERKNEYYKEMLSQISKNDLYPGVVPFIKALRARGTKTALCSSSKNAQAVLDRLKLGPLFDIVVTGSDITHAKPHPEIFLRAAEQLMVPPFHCMVFEDAASGVEAAHAAKMKCIGVGLAAHLPTAHCVMQHYADLDVDALLDTGRPRTVTPEAWSVTQTEPEPRRAQYWETLFALSNGLLGLRGSFEEEDEAQQPHANPGFFVNGIYDYEPYHHIWGFPGFATHKHAMLNLIDWRIINLTVDGERFNMGTGSVRSFRRSLDLKRGIVTRELVWQSPGGTQVKITGTRLVSMARRHSAAIRYQVTPLTPCREIVFESVVKEGVRTSVLKEHHHVQRLARQVKDGHGQWLLKTRGAPFSVGMAVDHRVTGAAADVQVTSHGETTTFTITVRAPAATVTLDKHVAVFTSVESDAQTLTATACAAAAQDAQDTFAMLLAEQTAFWRRYWNIADIAITGNLADQQALRFSLFHLRQSHPEDPHRSISANGMTGDHYCGHIFWDTEMYMLPHFLYTQPATVKSLLMYRYHILEQARARAVQMQGHGALFSWNSISGEECGVVFEAATAEYHLESAIAYAIWRYTDATDDTAFLFQYGAEILFETARFLADRGAFVPHKGGKFCLNAVCGPDEYACGVNNNCYTNVMTQWHLRYARQVYDRMRRECPDVLAVLCLRIGLHADELALWKKAAERMYIPFNKKLGLHEQDDSFLALDPVDMRRVPRNTDIREMLHPLNLWRMQVAKQADVVLLMLVQGDQFTTQVKRANYEFYEPRTCHGSSLSACIHSIVAAEVGTLDDAYNYFRQSVRMDLNDFKNNTRSGVHSACLGGTWMAVVNGFGGMRDYPRGLQFAPQLPPAWQAYRFSVVYRGRRINVAVTARGTTFMLVAGDPLTCTVYSKRVRLEAGKRLVVRR